jgi:hypothetical protein
MDADDRPDAQAIRALVARQFSSLSWTELREADWSAFAGDFHEDASLWPSARPAKRQSVPGFLEQMQRLAKSTLTSREERVVGTEVRVFGNIAVAAATCEMLENDGPPTRTVEMLLLVKDEGRWRVVAQAWDKDGEAQVIPAGFLGA